MDEDIRNREFIGQGLAFPLQFSPRGQIALATNVRDIEQAIYLILGTMPGERVMRPEFGCRVWELVFAPHTPDTVSLIVTYVKRALRFWEPRIEVDKVEVQPDENDDGALLVVISYTVKVTHDERSIVYPFYIVNEENA